MEAKRRGDPPPLSSGDGGQEQPGPGKILKPEERLQRLLPVVAAAKYLGVSRATVERLVSRGQLPVVKVGACTRYDVEDLDGFIATYRNLHRRRSTGMSA
jgi:excisionase family DNA binding protein